MISPCLVFFYGVVEPVALWSQTLKSSTEAQRSSASTHDVSFTFLFLHRETSGRITILLVLVKYRMSEANTAQPLWWSGWVHRAPGTPPTRAHATFVMTGFCSAFYGTTTLWLYLQRKCVKKEKKGYLGDTDREVELYGVWTLCYF